MRIFGGEQIASLMTRFKMPENVPLSHSMVTRVIEQIQVKVEGFNFDIRKSLVEFDDVVNKQRTIIYRQRDQVLEDFAKKPIRLKKKVLEILREQIKEGVSSAVDPETLQPDLEKVILSFAEIFPVEERSEREAIKRQLEGKTEEEMVKILFKKAKGAYEEREEKLGKQAAREIDKSLLLYTIDQLWIEHLTTLDALREGVRLRGYGQRDPLVEYRKESFKLFQSLLARMDYHLARRLLRVMVEPTPQLSADQAIEGRGKMSLPDQPASPEEVAVSSGQASQSRVAVSPVVSGKKKIGRNDPCWCGSGKKWKKCHYPDPGPYG
jgi:preprotein translocase subunit SecA